MRYLPTDLRVPGVCHCGATVHFDGKRWTDRPGKAHACPAARCGAWMPNNRERCARRPGHNGTPGRGYGHRSAAAMANARRAA